MPGGGDEVRAALPDGWRVPKIVAATRWMLASRPLISRLSVEEVSPHRNTSSQYLANKTKHLEYADTLARPANKLPEFYC
jgi:hypothetical protein